MYKRFLMRACAIVMFLGIGDSANASFHLWQISEIYSNADGTVQFIELATAAGGQQFVAGHAITSSQGATTHSFTLPSNLPSDTTNKTFLIGTQGFAALNLVTPDYVVPNNFLFIPNGIVDWAGVDSVSYASLPTDGSLSIDRNGATGINSPRNFAGATGTIVPATVPGAPTIGAATAGNGQTTIAFTAPVSNGGSPITSYTVTCGALSATGAASPITVTGLTNGTTYTCSVTATSAVGTGPASATTSVTPSLNTFAAPSATGTGNITASFVGGGAACSFVTPQFIGPPPGAAPIPPTTPGPGMIFPQGLFDFRANGCTPGSTITLTISYPSSIAGAIYWKYGPTAANPVAHWYVLPATLVGNTATFTITDGGLGDDDLAANGTIVDQGGPGFGPGTAGAFPTLSEWAMALMAGLLLMFGMGRLRRVRN